MPQNGTQLIGSWTKSTHSSCSLKYPDHIEFQARGLYVGRKKESGSFTLWDAGTYQLVNSTQIKISVANDAIVTYQVSMSGDSITFVDPEQCRFQYRRDP